MSLRILRNEHVSAILLILIALMFAYSDVILGEKSFVIQSAGNMGTMPFPDKGSYGYSGDSSGYASDPLAVISVMQPWSRFISESLKQGELPLWNPHQGLGIAFHATGHSALFDPLLLIVHGLPTSWWPVLYDWQLLIRYFFAAFFTYLFARAIGLSFPASVIAGIGFIFLSQFADINQQAQIRVYAVLPINMYAFHRLAVQPSKKTFLFAAFSILLVFLVDFVELLPMNIVQALLWYAVQVFYRLRATPLDQRLKTAVKMFTTSIVAVVMGVALGAFIVLPFVQWLSFAAHVHTPGTDYIKTPALNQILGYFVSNYTVTAFGSEYQVLTMMTVLIGLFKKLPESVRKAWRQSMFILAIGIFWVMLSFQIPPVGWLANLPIINMIRLYVYGQVYIGFCLAITSAMIIDLVPHILWKDLMITIIISSIIYVVLALTAWPYIFSDNRVFINYRILAILGGSYGLLVFRWVSKWRPSKLRKAIVLFSGCIICLPMMVRFDPPIINFLSGQTPYANSYNPYTVPPFVNYLQNQPKPFRITAEDGIIYPNIASAYGIDDARYLDATNPADYESYRLAFLTPPVDPDDFTNMTRYDGIHMPPLYSRHLDLLNVRYVLTTKATPPTTTDGKSPFTLVHHSAGVYIYQNLNAYSRAFVVRNVEVISSKDAILNRLAAPDLDTRRTVILSEPLPQNIQQRLNNVPLDTDQVVVTEGLSGVTVEVALEKSGFLVLSDLYFPEWTATIDGVETHIYKANGIMRAVYVDEGTHRIEFQYRPRLFIFGLLISLFTSIVLALALWRIKQDWFWKVSNANPE